MLRIAADFENFKKRSRRDLKEGTARAVNQVALDFLPVLDNLERAIEHGETPGDDEDKTLLSGVKMVAKQFLAALARHDIESFDSVGQPFDPEFHEALQQIDSDLPRNAVARELQKGYRSGDRLVRPALVIVSKGPEDAPSPSEVAEEANENSPEDVADTTQAEQDTNVADHEGDVGAGEEGAGEDTGTSSGDSESDKKADE